MLQDIIKNGVRSMAEKLEHEIMNSLPPHAAGLSLAEIATRITVAKIQGKPGETYAFDGDLFLWAGEIEISPSETGLRLDRVFRRLSPNA
jgi:hypothetical protein